ncbi:MULTISPECIES: DUF6328 family protein [Amycolatopsis]|uniref:DUF6328 family protein n=1 Tax=Amycolatopsis albidoflavus TaxID=102226 RepID=A0ABW5HRX3_9PSEU
MIETTEAVAAQQIELLVPEMRAESADLPAPRGPRITGPEVRVETQSQRLHRNYAELLQEVRVAQTGVQLLLASMLTMVFTPLFSSFSHFQRGVYVTALILGVAANALLVAPAVYHRVIFGCNLRQDLVRTSNVLVLAGFSFLMLSLSAAFLLVLSIAIGPETASAIAAGALTMLVSLWYVLPIRARLRKRR